MQAGLTGVHKISSTFGAFAAVLIDGSMVPWGCGVFNTCDAFAVALKDGTVVTWGERDMAEKLDKQHLEELLVDEIHSTFVRYIKRRTASTNDPIVRDRYQ